MHRTLLLLTLTLVSALPAREHDERAIFAAPVESIITDISPTFITITREPTATFDPCPTVTTTVTTTTTKTVTVTVKPTVLPTITIRPTRTLVPLPTYTIGPVDLTFIAYDDEGVQE